MPSGRDLNAEARGKIMRLALAGVPIKVVAQRLGISEASVRKYYPLPKKHAPIGNKAP